MSTSDSNIPEFIARRVWWVIPLIAWAAVVGGSLASHFAELEAHSQRVAVEGARNMFRVVVLVRAWNALHGGVYLPVSEDLQPNPYLEHPRRDLVTQDGQALTMVNPAYMTRLISEQAKAEDGATFHITSLRPIRPANMPDPWEQKALQAFETGLKEAIEIIPGDDGQGRHLRYMAPLFVSKPCLECHAKQQYRVGDVRGGISVTTPFSQVDETIALGKRQTTIKHLSIFLLGAVVGFILLELLRRRWFKLNSTIAELKKARIDLDNSNQELRQAKDVAEAANIAKSEFLANMSHEFRTPLNAISGFGHLLRHSLNDPQHVNCLDHIQNASGQLLEMIEQLLKLSRADTGKLEQRVERFEVSQLADEAFTRLRVEAEAKGLAYRLQIDDATMPCWLLGDRQHIFDIMTHYLGNAVKFSERGEIALIVTCTPFEGGHTLLHIEVKDQGIGIAAEHLPSLFSLFHQVDGSATRRYGGNGVGLILCKRLAELMGGEVGVASTPGEGSRFWLDIRLTNA
ncbi:MAG: His Kinase (phospho-acceptor) protein [Proteobacteria bacterium]|nr:His Kinase (phospho-acceptor) protein [Pseudomonadota bacterium]